MTSILSCPPEITVQILLCANELSSVVSLVSTCRQLYSVWQANAPMVIWTVGQRCIPAFDDALMAVRATNAVRPAFEAGELTPDVGPIELLSGVSRLPTPVELKQVMDIQHLARCLQHMFFYHRHDGRSDQAGLFCSQPPSEYFQYLLQDGHASQDQLLRKWEERFRRATYRLFLAGAVLSRAYNEPFFLHPEYTKTKVSTCFMAGEWDYLRKFAIYHNAPNLGNGGAGKEGPGFEPLSSWIVDTAKREAVRRAFIPYWKTQAFLQETDEIIDEDEEVARSRDDADVFAEWEIMTMVIAYELTDIKFSSSQLYNRWPADLLDRARKIRVVRFGVFKLEEITMPARVEDTVNIWLSPAPIPLPLAQLPQEAGSATRGPVTGTEPYSWDVRSLLQRLPLPPDHYEWAPGPHTPLQFFAYTLRKHLRLRFSDMDATWASSTYHEVVGDATVFIETVDGHQEYNWSLHRSLTEPI